MNTKFSASTLASAACVAALTLGASGAAQAQEDIYWSIGMSSPGVQIGMSNAPTVYVQPPVYVQAPVYVQQRPVYVAPRQVVYMPPQPVVYGYPGYGYRNYREHEGYRGYGYRNEQERVGYRGYGYRGEERFEHRGEGRFEQERGGRSIVRAESHIQGQVQGRGEARVANDNGRRH
jgi:hypothetical protein